MRFTDFNTLLFEVLSSQQPKNMRSLGQADGQASKCSLVRPGIRLPSHEESPTLPSKQIQMFEASGSKVHSEVWYFKHEASNIGPPGKALRRNITGVSKMSSWLARLCRGSEARCWKGFATSKPSPKGQRGGAPKGHAA